MALLALTAGSAFSFPIGTKLSIPELVAPSRFSLQATKLPPETRVVIFYYSASYCAPCKKVSTALKSVYPEIIQKTEGLAIVSYGLDQSISRRAEYLRTTAFPWPGLSPHLLDKKPWLDKIPGGTPQFQAFSKNGDWIQAITEPGSPEEIFPLAFEALSYGWPYQSAP